MRTLTTTAAVWVLVLVLTGLAFAGTCRNCGALFRGEGAYCPDCARRFEVEQDRAAKELAYIEQLTKARREYEKAVEDLLQYYVSEGIQPKAADAKREQKALAEVPRYQYLSLAELRSPNLTPSKAIPEAERLFQEGLRAYNRFAWPWRRKAKYAEAIRLFTELVEKYPESDRIDDAAYYLGRCYETKRFAEYHHAILWYQRSYQWNPKTEHDPRYRMGRIYEEHLGQRDKALECYQLVVRDSANPEAAEKAQRRIDRLGGQAARRSEPAEPAPAAP